MIVYNLRCRNAHEFEGWFRDSAAFDEQSKGGKLTCPVCDSRKVEKAIMAPRLARADVPEPPPPIPAEAKTLLPNPVQFDAGFRLEEAALVGAAEGHASSLHFTWSATHAVSLDRKVAVHLLDRHSRILGQLD